MNLELPLIAAAPPAAQEPSWHGLVAVAVPATEAPEPLEPQGAYGAALAEPISLPLTVRKTPAHPAELLAPAGGPEAGFAAFHFGADAIYLGLQKFSARAEAENFTLEEVDEITAYAHSLTPRRRVFVTINTLIRQDELAELVADVAALEAMGVDALIIQDLGVYQLVRHHFPDLELHASTQLAVHNHAGAVALRQLGFKRVVLARELTFEEVHDITSAAGVETEVFIHGALCYSYSGLCLFSSQTLGRSGNRGRCAYSCRDAFQVTGAPETLRDGTPVKRNPGEGFPFSMKDLALPDHIPALRSAGVSCFKIEGRKKSPLYVATTTDYYRRLLDGRLQDEERPALEADMQTVFSRPWTHLFVQSHKDKEVADRDTVGHRGSPIGQIEGIHRTGRDVCVRFHTARALQKHDGLQVDLPVLGKPFGFPVDHLWLLTGGRKGHREEVFETTAGSLIEVALPEDYPDLPIGAPIYCSSSQDVKQRYRHERPKPGLFHQRRSLEIDATLTEAALTVTGRIETRNGPDAAISRTVSLAGPFGSARDAAAMAEAFRGAFMKLGETPFTLGNVTFHNPECRFVPVSRLNALRRDLVAELEHAVSTNQEKRTAAVLRAALPPVNQERQREGQFQWSLKVDRIGFLEALEPDDWSTLDELVVDITRDHPTLLAEQLQRWRERLGPERIRLALPALTRKWEEKGLRHKIDQLRAAGWRRWEVANLSAWHFLGQEAVPGKPTDLDLASDWSMYVLNRLAAQALLDLGVQRFALSPEDGLANMASLLAEFADRAVVIVYQDTPQFLAESCAYANLIGGCPGKANCRFESMDMVSTHGEKVTALDYHCRTIVLNQGAYCIAQRVQDLHRIGAVHLRADFVYRKYDPAELRDIWRLVRQGKPIPGGHAANFDRGVL